MEHEISISLVYNMSLLLALSIIYALIPTKKFNFRGLKSILAGCIIGLVGMAIMYNPFLLSPGIVLDVRSILIAVSGLFFGLIPTVIAVVMTSLFRIYQGGGGTLVGVCVIVLSAIIGLLWRHFRFKKLIEGKKKRWFELYLLGIAAHVGMLACFFLLPWDTAITMLKTISLPVMIIYPIGTVLLGMILLKQIDSKNIYLQLNESEKSMHRLFSNMFDAFAMRETYYDANKKLTGYKVIKSNKVFDQTFGDNKSQDMVMCELCINDETACHNVYRRVAKTGISEMFVTFCPATKKHFEVSVYSTGKDRFATIYKDITELKNSEKLLFESEKKYRAIFDQAKVGICNVSLEGNVINANKKYREIFGYSLNELKELSFLDRAHPDDILKNKVLFSELKDGKVDDIYTEKKGIRKDGTVIFTILSATVLKDEQNKPLYIVTIVQDITEQKLFEEEKRKLDEHLTQQQRLESIGTLAGGVAHEINNPINGIMNYSQLILDSSETDGENAEYAKEIIHESERVATIVKNLLQFSRHDKQAHSYASIETIIEQTLSLIRTVIRHDQIDLQVDISKDLPDLKCRSQQIQQVIMNLLTNARDSLNQRYKGYHEDKIIKIQCKQFSKQKRKWLKITVEDQGEGISPDVQKKMFNPFFTTKSRDEGTGLGLAISHGIVKEHHGELTFDTKVGSCTRFYLDLPCDNGWEIED